MAGERTRCLIIAEAGSNHNGSLELATRLIDAAAEAGADAVKFQLFRASTLYPDTPVAVDYLRRLGIEEGLFELIKKYEVPADWIPVLADYCRQRRIEFMATPFDLEAVEALNPYVARWKIATYESSYGSLLRAALATGKELIVSVGAMDARELDALFAEVLQGAASRVTVLQCIAKYPAPIEAANLRVLPWIRERYGVRVGFSDHTLDPLIAPVAAVALGASVIEKHFTLDRALPGPDHSFALEPQELTAMVRAIRAAETSLGDGVKRVHAVEEELSRYKRCYYLTRPVAAGSRLRAKDLQVLRNTGQRVPAVAPLNPDRVVGRQLARDKAQGDILLEGDMA